MIDLPSTSHLYITLHYFASQDLNPYIYRLINTLPQFTLCPYTTYVKDPIDYNAAYEPYSPPEDELPCDVSPPKVDRILDTDGECLSLTHEDTSHLYSDRQLAVQRAAASLAQYEDEQGETAVRQVIPAPEQLTPEVTDDALQEADLELTHIAISAVYGGWNQATSIKEITSLATVSVKLIECRRKVLHRTYGVNAKAEGGGVLYPIG